mmetsp:Transcript_30088/g.26665  ORF Transcript_30088/g.26665 Transcript_30088/m.26665 type:complete len:116 (+) Transcript_30088:685-1032(+)
MNKKRRSCSLSHDKVSGVHNYQKIFVPNSERNTQVKLIFVPQDKYFFVVLTSTQLDIYKLNTETKTLDLMYTAQQEEGIGQVRRSFTRDDTLIVLGIDGIYSINLLEMTNPIENP